MPTVAAIGISAAVGAYSAHKASEASKQASQIQVDTSNKAMDYQQQAQQQALAYLDLARSAPMAQAGPAQTYLSKLMGIPGGANFNQQSSYAPPPAFPGHSPMGPSMTQPYAMQPPSMPNMGRAQPGGLMGAPSGPTPNGNMVMLEAPTGERRAVPADQAQAMIAGGAKRVN